MPPCILLTATIHTGNTPNVAIPNPKEREEQYLAAVKFYLKLGIPLVFCENSNTRSAKILAVMHGIESCEYLAFPSQLSYLGKSHGEKEIMDYAFEHSVLLCEADWVIKISGRYIIRNIKQIISDILNVKSEVFANFSHHLSWCDTKLMVFKKSFYFDYFKSTAEQNLDDRNKVCLEKIFARSLHKFIADGRSYTAWEHYPYYSGICGGSGKHYNFSFTRKLKFLIYMKAKNWIYRQHV